MSDGPGPTFRDPAGWVQIEHDRVVRTVYPAAQARVLEFLASPLCQRLEAQGYMVTSRVEDSPCGLRLVHPKIAVPTYPWEWSPSQWLAAGDLTLNVCDEAVDQGWILKDATPLNILFEGPRPVLVDVLSFERRAPESSAWMAYAQYVRTFLLPLLMNQLLNWPLALSLFKRDGYEPAELYEALGWRQRLSRRGFWPITLPAWLEKRKPAETFLTPTPRLHEPDLALHLLKRNLEDLRRQTRRALPRSAASNWSQYKGNLTHYSAADSERKRAWVREALEELRPARVLDVGANTGEFSKLAAECGAQVIALERDVASAERIFRMSTAEHLAIQTIQADLAQPTPAAGWENRETSPLLARLEGQSDLMLMLAVIHHLLLMEQIPLPAILELCHRLTRRHMIVEWVPVHDPMYQSLMRGRTDLYGSLGTDDLLAACEGRFKVVREHMLDNGRILFLLSKIERPASA